MPPRELWYIKNENGEEGPFPSRVITDFILLGRLTESHEISLDRKIWSKVRDVPQITPEELKLDLNDPENQERLILAKRRADVRTSEDRRSRESQEAITEDNKREKSNRRQPESYDIFLHRTRQTDVKKQKVDARSGLQKKNAIILVSLLLIIGMIMFMMQPDKTYHDSDCNTAPQPGVYWENCKKQGADLTGARLMNAHMRNSNFTSAAFTGAQLGWSDLSYSNLSRARLEKVNLDNANLFGATMRNANLQSSHIKGANMSYSILEGANLSYARLWNTDLSNANLKGAIMLGADLFNTRLDNAIWVDGKICQPGSVSKCLVQK
jgi:hypothetical protein